MSHGGGRGDDPYGDYDAATGAHSGGTSPYELSNLPPGSWQEPATSGRGAGPPSSPPGGSPPGSAPDPGGPGSTRTAVIVLSVLALLLIAAGAFLTSLLLSGSGGSDEPTPEATTPPTEPEDEPTNPDDDPSDDPAPDPGWPAPEDPDIAWDVNLGDLRDLRGASFVPNISGADSPQLGKVNGLWFAVSADGLGEEAMLHGFDPDSGEELWSRRLDLALCAADAAPSGEIVCASAVDREPGEFATQWRLHLLDPQTGQDVSTEDIDLHVRALRLNAAGIVVLEDREPAPDAWLHLYDYDLAEVWSLALAEVPEAERMFSEWAYSPRPGPWTDEDLREEMLDLGALGEVGPEGGLIALQVYAHAIVVDAATGELLGDLMSCFDMVDDGEYLWCGGALDRLNVYDYEGELVLDVLADTGLQGGLLGLHPRSEERILSERPLTHNWDGELLVIDPEDGEAGAPYAETDYDYMAEEGTFRFYGSSAYSGGHAFAVTAELGRMLMLEPGRDEVRWEFSAPRISGLVAHNEVAYVENSHSGEVVRLDLEDGSVLGTWQIVGTRQLRIHDDALVGIGLTGITRFDVE